MSTISTASLVALLAEGVDRNRMPRFFAHSTVVALLAEGVDRNSPIFDYVDPYCESPSSRRAWIEIVANTGHCAPTYVALLAEGVDRNMLVRLVSFQCALSPSSRRAWIEIGMAALLPLVSWSPSSRRAWIEIDSSVGISGLEPVSPSSRRAWIEIYAQKPACVCCGVALLAEGVDRNSSKNPKGASAPRSPSSRRAWIEII